MAANKSIFRPPPLEVNKLPMQWTQWIEATYRTLQKRGLCALKTGEVATLAIVSGAIAVQVPYNVTIYDDSYFTKGSVNGFVIPDGVQRVQVNFQLKHEWRTACWWQFDLLKNGANIAGGMRVTRDRPGVASDTTTTSGAASAPIECVGGDIITLVVKQTDTGAANRNVYPDHILTYLGIQAIA